MGVTLQELRCSTHVQWTLSHKMRTSNQQLQSPLWLLLATLALLLATSTAQLTFVTNTTELLRDAITDNGNAVAASPSSALRVGPGVSAALSIVGGLAVCFFGFRLMRPTMFLCGFVVGGFLCASAADVVFKGKSYEATAWWIALIVGGILIGALVLVLYSIGIFIVGAAGGVLLGTVVNTSIGYKLFPNDPNTGLLVFAIVLGLLGGILACKLERPVIILATSLVGAVLAVSGVGYFAKDFPDITDLQTQFGTKDAASGAWSYDLPTVWWAYIGAMLVLFVLGAFVQFKKTSRSGSSRHDNAKMGGYSHA